MTRTFERADFFELLASARGVQLAEEALAHARTRLVAARETHRHVLMRCGARYDFDPDVPTMALDDVTCTVTLPDEKDVPHAQS